MEIRKIDQIIVGQRERQDLGDVASLAASIAEIGLLHPLVITPQNRLVAGQRRLEACRILGWQEVPVHVADSIQSARDALLAERDENVQRKDLAPSEALAIGEKLEPLEKELAAKRMLAGRPYANFAQGRKGVALEHVAEAVGMSRETYRTAKRVMEQGIAELVQIMDQELIAISQAAKVAKLDPTEQHEIVAQIQAGQKPTDATREVKRKRQREDLENIRVKKAKALLGVYDVIVIDPPWPISKIERDERPYQAKLDYPTMSVKEIKGLKIPAAQDCHLWLWTTQKFLPDAFEVLQSWNFKYVCTFVWHKPGGFQPYDLPQYNCEFALYARCGAPEFLDTKNFSTCFNAPRGRHSEKPDEFYTMIRRVTAGRRLDMFNRRLLPGFEVWGNET